MFPALDTVSPAASRSLHHTLFDIMNFVPETESQNQLLLPKTEFGKYLKAFQGDVGHITPGTEFLNSFNDVFQ